MTRDAVATDDQGPPRQLARPVGDDVVEGQALGLRADLCSRGFERRRQK